MNTNFTINISATSEEDVVRALENELSKFKQHKPITPTKRQKEFLECNDSLKFFGSGSGSGKTTALLLDALKNEKSVVIVRQSVQATLPGGLVDASIKLYEPLGGVYYRSRRTWEFPDGSQVKFASYNSYCPTIYEGYVHYIEEVQTFPMKFFKDISLSNVTRCSMTATYDNWVGELFKPDMVSINGTLRKDKTKGIGYSVFAATCKDNEHLDEEFSVSLKSLPYDQVCQLHSGCWFKA